jgi:hypothetical protein
MKNMFALAVAATLLLAVAGQTRADFLSHGAGPSNGPSSGGQIAKAEQDLLVLEVRNLASRGGNGEVWAQDLLGLWLLEQLWHHTTSPASSNAAGFI